RGRLNVLANVVGNLTERIFTAFEGSVHPNFPADEGDVKYHQGAVGERIIADGRKVTITVSPNPSHLEFVDAVVEGMVRAKQDVMPAPRGETIDRAMPVLLHGDAAFAGQGIVMETLNLADLKGYRTGGTIHIIINNQIGFTTSPEASRSTIYSTDVARMTQLPIFHVNGDDPEAAFRVLRIALEYRQEFNRDVVLDVIGFRRLGHNEGDEPSYTQPLMYARVKAHPGVRAKYTERLVRDGVLTEADVEQMTKDVSRVMKRRSPEPKRSSPANAETGTPPPIVEEDGSRVFETDQRRYGARGRPQNRRGSAGFSVNPKMVTQLRGAQMGDGEVPMDWAFAKPWPSGRLRLKARACA
ncbi:MAG: thiamine pyrophosphate-dependent enzyme, partial [Pyrinomonadaceae bacterium]